MGSSGARKAALVAMLVAALAVPHAAGAAYAPPSQKGPKLDVAKAKLAKSLACTPHLGQAKRKTVLLIPGTTLNPDVEYSWNWLPALLGLRWPHCTVELPDDAMGDIQTAAEYVVNAVRRVRHRSGRKVQIVGHSQGGMIGRWALRFWPDTRRKVADLVGFAPSNHGTVDSVAFCAAPGGCPASFWQQTAGSNFIDALNSYRETFRGVSYTSVYTHADEVVVPNLDDTGSSSLHGGGGKITNVAIQDVCPADLSDHLAIATIDNTAYALAIDALTHRGPADPARLDAADVCTRPLMPGVDPATFAIDFAAEGVFLAQTIAAYPKDAAEPPLRCYVTASCGKTHR
jgi:pimeloyl-ACP methyl ester carboxylesterase